MRRCLLLAVVCTLAAATPATVGQLVAAARTALQHHDSDSHLAGTLRKFQLTERLDRRFVEELESAGAGPKSVAELEALVEDSAALPQPANPPAFSSVPEPTAADKARILQDAARNALNYAASLPDFLCTETVRRYEDFKGKPHHDWKERDTLTLRLSYYSHVENYKLAAINGKKTYRTYEEMAGAVTQGEFGSLLISIFKNAPSTRFQWDHWTTLRKRPALVYSFHIPIEESNYEVHYGTNWTRPMAAVTAQRGFVYVDRDSGRVVRVYAEADAIPADFPVTNIYTLLDYDFVTVGGHPYVLPIRALIRMGTRDVQTRNEVHFAEYRKFASDTNITYDLDAPKKQ